MTHHSTNSKFDSNYPAAQVAYKAGENEKLLGEFIKKHNVRDKLFGEYGTVFSFSTLSLAQ